MACTGVRPCWSCTWSPRACGPGGLQAQGRVDRARTQAHGARARSGRSAPAKKPIVAGARSSTPSPRPCSSPITMGQVEYVNEGVRHAVGARPRQAQGHAASGAHTGGAGRRVIRSSSLLALRRLSATRRPRSAIVRMSDSRGALRELSARLQVFQIPEGKRLSIRLREAAGPLAAGARSVRRNHES